MSKTDHTKAVVAHAMRRIRQIDAGMSGGSASAAARQLAVLRHGLGDYPGSRPDAWNVAFDGCPEELLGYGTEPSDAERAIYLVLTLYAMHRQGQSSPMHSDKATLGGGARQIAAASEATGGTPKMPTSFASLVTADSVDEMEHHLRQTVLRLRAKGIRINYATLARQVFWFANPYRRDGIRLEWSREYTRFAKESESAEEQSRE